jgi:hypothetical protein
MGQILSYFLPSANLSVSPNATIAMGSFHGSSLTMSTLDQNMKTNMVSMEDLPSSALSNSGSLPSLYHSAQSSMSGSVVQIDQVI